MIEELFVVEVGGDPVEVYHIARRHLLQHRASIGGSVFAK
jgi:hypothetical protein